MNFTTKFIKKELVAKDTYMYSIEKPKGFQYEAGQFTSLYLPGYNDENPKDFKHTFSICSSPDEPVLQFATRIRKSDFKKGVMKLTKGTEVQLGHPGGSMTLPESEEYKLVFLVGGIGVTPVRSILRYVKNKKKKYNIKVILSNKTKKTTPFFDEFSKDYADMENVEIFIAMTEEKSWQGEKGRINKKMIEKLVGNFNDHIFYVVGPEGFTDGMRKLLIDNNARPEDIKGDTFYGYED